MRLTSMSFRLICGGILVICSCLAGFEKRSRLSVRLRGLAVIRDYFRNVKLYISHAGMSLDDIAYEIDRSVSRSQFSRIIRENTQHSDFASSFAAAISSLKNEWRMLPQEEALVCSLAGKIGGMDRDGAVELLELADEQISSLMDSVKRKYDTDGKLYVVLGLAFGIVAALLLI